MVVGREVRDEEVGGARAGSTLRVGGLLLRCLKERV